MDYWKSERACRNNDDRGNNEGENGESFVAFLNRGVNKLTIGRKTRNASTKEDVEQIRRDHPSLIKNRKMSPQKGKGKTTPTIVIYDEDGTVTRIRPSP